MKREVKPTVSFYLRSNKQKQGKSPIMLRVSFNRERKSFGQVGLSIDSSLFHQGRAIGNSSEAKEINMELNRLETKIQLLAELLDNNGRLTLDNLKEELKGKKVSLQYVSVLFNELLEESKKDYINEKITKGTLERHHTYSRVFMNFLSFEYSRKDLRVDEITRPLISAYEEYLLKTLGFSHNNHIKYLRWLGRATDKAMDIGTLTRDPFNGIAYNEEKVDRGFLDETELARLMKTDIQQKHLDFTRDAFVFSCFTGLAYCDVAQLKKENIAHSNGEKWLLLKRKKTKEACTIPLLPQALAILEKYEDKMLNDGRLLPIPCNQVINRQLKEVQQICGIDKNLSFHLARHTFGTLALTKGVSIETVAKILGHKKLSTTQIYARILPAKVAKEMSLLNNVLQNEKHIV